MNKTKRVGLSTIAAFAMAACTFATLGMANGISANAEAVEPTPAAEGWYIVGNGAGSLSESSWTDYVPAFKLDGAAGRVGTFTYENLSLYEGDAFKLLYANGEWAYPNDSGWTADVTGQFSNLATNIDGYFVNGGLGNIQVTEAGEGIYDLTLTVSATGISLAYERTGSVVPIEQEKMYVVGSLQNYEDCNWPGAVDVATCCPAMTLNKVTGKWSVELVLAEGDIFKVYNLVNNAYFPSGVNNDCVIAEEGIYLVEYETKAPSFTVTNVESGEVVYPVAS